MAVSASNALTEGAAIRPFRIELPQEEIGGLRRRALALIITRRWPGSVVELLNVADPLTDPTAPPQRRLARRSD